MMAYMSSALTLASLDQRYLEVQLYQILQTFEVRFCIVTRHAHIPGVSARGCISPRC